MRALRILIVSCLLPTAIAIAGTAIAFSLKCQRNFDPRSSVSTGEAKRIFSGVATSDVRFQVTMEKKSKCPARIHCVGGLNPGNSESVPSGESAVLGCGATADHQVTAVWLWCEGDSETCQGTWETAP